MGNSTQYSLPPVSLKNAENVKIGKLSLPVIGVEYSYPLQDGLKQLEINASGNGTQLSFRFAASGEYKIIPPANEYSISNINFNSKTLYIKCNKVDNVVVVEYY